jgi:hypothetical protein
MVASPFYGTTFYDRNLLISDWPIEEVRGIPNCGHRFVNGLQHKTITCYCMNWL